MFEYDEVLEEQRARLFAERKFILETEEPKNWVIECCELVIEYMRLINIKKKLKFFTGCKFINTIRAKKIIISRIMDFL